MYAKISPLLSCIAVIFLALALAYLPTLRHYFLSGDDLFLIQAAPRSFSEVGQRLTDFSGQYRPLTQTLFTAYRAFLPHSSIIFGLNFFLLVIVAGLFFVNIQRFLSRWPSLFLTISIFLSPIFYYHFFAIASLNNTLILLFGLLSLFLIDFPGAQNFPSKSHLKLTAAVLFFTLAILSKESFLVNGLLFAVILYQNLKARKRILAYMLTIILVSLYFGVHFLQYQTGGHEEYALRVSASQLIQTGLNMAAWLAAYPRGWQYAAADPKNIFTYLVSLLSLLSLGGIFAAPKKLLTQWRTQFLLAGAFLLSLLPFFAISRVLVFYLDAALLILVFWVVVNLRLIESQRFRAAFVILFGAVFLFQYTLYFSQWHKYSFVANAQETVHNLNVSLQENNANNFPTLCITNHSQGRWATKDGQVANLLFGYEGKIISVNEDTVPEECHMSNVLLLRNDGWQYKPEQ